MRLAIGVALLFVIACGGGGGGGGSTSNPPPATQSVDGLYNATITSSTAGPFSAWALASGGEIRYCASSGYSVTGTVAISGNSGSGAGTFFPPMLDYFPGSVRTIPISYTLSNVATRQSASGSYSSSFDSGTMVFTFDSDTDRQVTLADLAGTYRVYPAGYSGNSEVVISAAGEVTKPSGSSFSSPTPRAGTVSQPTSNKNLFNVAGMDVEISGFGQLWNGHGFLAMTNTTPGSKEIWLHVNNSTFCLAARLVQKN